MGKKDVHAVSNLIRLKIYIVDQKKHDNNKTNKYKCLNASTFKYVKNEQLKQQLFNKMSKNDVLIKY